MRTELDVPFSHKDEAKALGAKWDRVKKIWYVPDGVNPEPLPRGCPAWIAPTQRALHLPGAGQARMLEVSRADDGRGLLAFRIGRPRTRAARLRPALRPPWTTRATS